MDPMVLQMGQQPMITQPVSGNVNFIDGKVLSMSVKGLGAVSSGMLAYSLKESGTKWPTALWITSGVMALFAAVDAYNLKAKA